ncbi:unnamed protein product [Allacma fusca]|uniref:GPI transamidase component PIG-S n=1 Tax=Allacma fusca TaxID=39272 RepID=A0A8J2K2Y5_9HEXA|nr:unnamed protein product [Allacma fusca]
MREGCQRYTAVAAILKKVSILLIVFWFCEYNEQTELVKMPSEMSESVSEGCQEQDLSKDDKPGKKSSGPEGPPPNWILWSAASYAIVMLVIGLPLWWKTTAVQRVFLPYDRMLESTDFLDEHFRIKIDVSFHGISATTTDVPLKGENKQDFPGYDINYLYTSIAPELLEIIYKTEDIEEVDSKLCELSSKSDESRIDTFRIYYVGRADLLKEYGRRLVFGNCRIAYYISNSNKLDPNLLRNLYEKLIPSSDSDEKFQLPLSLGYEVLFTLLVPQPEQLNYVWDTSSNFDKYVNVITKKLGEFADIKVRSQYLYYVRLNVNPSYDASRGLYQISYDQLPLVINPVEQKLSSFVSQNAALNFLIYGAPCEENPLHLLDIDGEVVSSNSFLVPQWGGIQIYNGNCSLNTNSTTTSNEQVSLARVMTVVASQFRNLVGIDSSEKSEDTLRIQKSAFRDWEVDRINRKRLRKLLYTSANTLHSLGQLLDQITNIVVTEEVGMEVEKSVNAMTASVESSAKGNLAEALRNAKTAFKSSEIAFHHPSNLAQLYFPDDQKYAIYIPLFLPIGIPKRSPCLGSRARSDPLLSIELKGRVGSFVAASSNTLSTPSVRISQARAVCIRKSADFQPKTTKIIPVFTILTPVRQRI